MRGSQRLQSATTLLGRLTCKGTVEKPAWIVGNGKYGPEVKIKKWDTTRFEYCIIANVNIRGSIVHRGNGNIEIRDSQVHNSIRTGIRLGGDNVAVVGSHVHHHLQNNRLGIGSQCGSKNYWVLDNLLEYNAEDGAQFGHGCKKNKVGPVFFAGNLCRNNRENCYDSKHVLVQVISGNTMLDHHPASAKQGFTFDDGTTMAASSSGSDGAAVIIGTDGESETTFFFDNVYRNNDKCVRIEAAVEVWASGEDCSNSTNSEGEGGYKFDKRGTVRLLNSRFENTGFMLTTTWRRKFNIAVGGYKLTDTRFRKGRAGTVTDLGRKPADEGALNEAFIRELGFAP